MWWKTKSVNTVLKTFNKALKDLECIEEERDGEILELNAKLGIATVERDRATRVKQKLEKIVE